MCSCRLSTCLCVVYVGEVWAYLPLAPLGCKSSHRSLVKIFFFFFFFFFIQCLGDGKVSRFFAKAFVFLKNITMFFMVFLIFLLFIRFAYSKVLCPKVDCLNLEKVMQFVRICKAVSCSSVSVQKSQCGSSASFALYACLFKLL